MKFYPIAFSLFVLTAFSGEVVAQKTAISASSVASTKLDSEQTVNKKAQQQKTSVPSSSDVSSKRKLDASVKRKPIERSDEMLERKKIEPKVTDPMY